MALQLDTYNCFGVSLVNYHGKGKILGEGN